MRVVPKSFPPKTGVWITAKHEAIPIRQMSSDHIKNCIALIRDSALLVLMGLRKRPFRWQYLDRLRHELEERGVR